MDGIIQGKKTLVEINNPLSLRMCHCLGKASPAPGGGHPQNFDINISNKPTYILHTMLEDIKKRMCALIAQHGSALAALRQQPEA
jgi:hypothetical protein